MTHKQTEVKEALVKLLNDVLAKDEKIDPTLWQYKAIAIIQHYMPNSDKYFIACYSKLAMSMQKYHQCMTDFVKEIERIEIA